MVSTGVYEPRSLKNVDGVPTFSQSVSAFFEPMVSTGVYELRNLNNVDGAPTLLLNPSSTQLPLSVYIGLETITPVVRKFVDWQGITFGLITIHIVLHSQQQSSQESEGRELYATVGSIPMRRRIAVNITTGMKDDGARCRNCGLWEAGNKRGVERRGHNAPSVEQHQRTKRLRALESLAPRYPVQRRAVVVVAVLRLIASKQQEQHRAGVVVGERRREHLPPRRCISRDKTPNDPRRSPRRPPPPPCGVGVKSGNRASAPRADGGGVGNAPARAPSNPSRSCPWAPIHRRAVSRVGPAACKEEGVSARADGDTRAASVIAVTGRRMGEDGAENGMGKKAGGWDGISRRREGENWGRDGMEAVSAGGLRRRKRKGARKEEKGRAGARRAGTDGGA
ncbi:hypothetical protein DFH09DRAFT_1083932 [Mycena vulgaris]|nr:hypothetical protein DFH09DRAFT_1083932 [Mycena vulgaris]